MIRKPKDARIVHKLIKSTAKEMAGAYYELRAHQSDEWYSRFPSQNEFVRQNWKNFVFTARQCLAKMLDGPHDEGTKREIYDALLLDSTVPYSIQETQVINVH